MFKPKRNIRIGGKVYYKDKLYSEPPRLWVHEFEEVEEEKKPAPKKRRKRSK